MKATKVCECVRCGKTIEIGQEMHVYNRPRPGSTFHAACPDEGFKVPPGQAPGQGERGEVEGKGRGGQGGQGRQDGQGEGQEGEGQGQGEGDEGQEGKDGQEGDKGKGKGKGKDGGIEEIIRDIVKDEVGKVEQKAPQRIEVKVPDLPPVDISEDHPETPRLLALLSVGIFPYLFGDAGTGKTTVLARCASILGRSMEIDTLDRSTPRSALLGYRTPQGEPVETQLTRCYREGGFLIHDEIDNSPAYVQSILNTALANGVLPTAWGAISMHPGFLYAAAGNTPMRPTPRYPDRQPGSFAYGDRLYWIEWRLDPNIERRACGRPLVKTPVRKPSTCTPQAWGAWVEGIREWTRENAPTIQVTPRATFIGLRALACGETPLEAAHGLVFRGADKGLVEKALNACPLPQEG